MSETRFDTITRSAILAVYDYACFYCGRPLEFDALEIDHIIGEHYEKKQEEFELLKKEYGLDPQFDVNGVFNLVPSDGNCNKKKGGKPYSKETTLHYLELAARNAAKIQQEIERLKKSRNRIITSSKLQAALAQDLIRTKELEAFLLEAKRNHWDTKEIKIPMPVEFMDEVFDVFYLNTDCSLLYDKKVLLGKSFYDLELVNESGEKKLVSTLREWKEAKSKGYFAASTFAMKMSDNFTFLDELIKALHMAGMPKVSFISDPWLEITNLDMLSPSFIWSMDGKQPPFDGSTSVGDLIRQGIVKINESYQFSIALEWNNTETFLIEQFRADFNHDGIEDIFVRGWTKAVGGSFGIGFTSIFTRRSEKHLIELLRI